MEQTAVADLHQAIGQAMLEEPAEQRDGVEMGGAWAGTAHCPGGEGDGTILAAHEAALGDGDLEDRGGEGGEGGVAVGSGLALDIPGDRPGLRIDLFQQTGLAHGSLQSAREMGASALTGTKKWALEGSQVVRSFERPPPGTMEWRWGWYGSGLPQGCRTPVHPGRSVPMQRSSVASRFRAVAEA